MEAADWASLSDQDLLERRISKLGLHLDGTTLDPLIRQLYDELFSAAAGRDARSSERRTETESGNLPAAIRTVI
jgi:hypothetical protein